MIPKTQSINGHFKCFTTKLCNSLEKPGNSEYAYSGYASWKRWVLSFTRTT